MEGSINFMKESIRRQKGSSVWQGHPLLIAQEEICINSECIMYTIRICIALLAKQEDCMREVTDLKR